MIITILGRAAQFFIALAMMRVATTLLTPEEIGRVSSVLTTIGFFALFLVNPIGMFINRRLHAWQASGVARHYLICYVNYLVLVALLVALVLPLLYAAGVVNFGVSIGWLVTLVCGSLLFNTINQTAIPSLNLLGDHRRFIALSVATVATSFACAVLLVHWARPEAHYWVLGLLIGQALLAAVGVGVLFSKLKGSSERNNHTPIKASHRRALLAFAWPVAIAASLSWAQGQGYRYLMEDRLGLEQLGLFVMGYGISAGIISGFESVLTTYFQPQLYKNANTDDSKKWKTAWQLYAQTIIPSLLLTSGFIVVLAPELTQLLLGEKFAAASQFVFWGAIAETGRLLASTYSLVAHIHMRTKWLILPNLVGALFAMGLAVVLMPVYGAEGAGVALAASAFAGLIAYRWVLGENADGALAWMNIFQAALFVGLITCVTWITRSMTQSASWIAAVETLLLSGVVYLGLQFALLKNHLARQ